LPDYEFSRQSVPIAGKPDFSAMFAFEFIAPIEIKSEHILQLFRLDGEQTFLYFDQKNQRYEMTHARDVIRQIFTYMKESQLQYGVLSTYQHHWFLRRPADEPSVLYISKTLPIQSQSPPVLKTYAYMVQVLCADSFSRNPVITTDKRNKHSVSCFESTTKSTKGIKTVIASKKKPSPSTNEKMQTPIQDLSFADFKYKSILGQGRSGKTLLCEFRGNTIALKCTDLSKNPHVLEEMQQEVNIYKILSDIQGIHIPNLLCYGFYGGMYYAIGMTLVGSALNNYKRITERQRVMGLLALNAIHDRGVLHNDIREENILLDDTNDVVYLIDFGMSRIHCDVRSFDEEKRKLTNLLDHYTY
jgi:predicted Ser/Thr protein kinase